jgi:glycosyltransferase involved in cell wall biosynthesis
MGTLTVDLRMYRHSGIGRYLRNLLPRLLPLLNADSVRVLCEQQVVGRPKWLQDQRVKLVETGAKVYSVSEQLLSLRGAYNGSDLLWVPHYNAPLYYPGLMVVTIHDMAPLALPEILKSALKRKYAKLLIERAVKQAAAILSVSEFTAKELRERLGVPAKKITVTHLGIDVDWPDTAQPHSEIDGVPYLLYVGNVKPNKNLGLLLRAFARVSDLLPYRVLLVGRMEGFGTGDQAAIAQAKKMGNRVRFAGVVPDKDLISLYAGASALVFPSLYEGFGLPLLEAMRFGCPVLCSTAASLPEVAGDAALYFDPHSEQELADSLLMVRDSAKMMKLRLAGEERIKQFSFQECAERSAGVMNRLLEEGRD